jgi:hypothetical protein
MEEKYDNEEIKTDEGFGIEEESEEQTIDDLFDDEEEDLE